MTNNIFQLNRFHKVIVRNLQRNPKSWLQSILIFTGLPLVFFLINLADFGAVNLANRLSFLEILIYFAFMFSPFVLFFNYNHPKKGLPEVMLPASVLEKYIVMQLACIVIAPLSVLVLYGGMDSLLASVFPRIFEGYAVQQLFLKSISFNNFSQMFLIQQAILFCNLLFVRQKVLKTTGVFILTSIIFLTITGLAIYIMNSQNLFDDTESISLNFGNRNFFEIYVDDHPFVITTQLARIFTQVVLPVALVIGSYFVMKKKRY
ncbi:MAG: hypothetical protein Q4G63_02190 [Bacteroidia bacterium]|nr:hypothetical protein [Bacteroidia bacterium]